MGQDQYGQQDPQKQYRQPDQQTGTEIAYPGLTAQLPQRPDHGEDSYRGSGRLEGRKAVVTGGDSGIGRAVVLAFAREGADVLISYLGVDAADSGHHAGRQSGVLRRGRVTDGSCRATDRACPAYVFFASQESSYITGEVLGVTGGKPVT